MVHGTEEVINPLWLSETLSIPQSKANDIELREDPCFLHFSDLERTRY